MKVTKQEVIKVLKTEPLHAGNFITNVNKTGECKVCAVGAIVRNAFPNIDHDDIEDICWRNIKGGSVPEHSHVNAVKQQVKEAIEATDYLGALSVWFEHLMRTDAKKRNKLYTQVKATKRIRDRLVTFVSKNFPDTINVAASPWQ